MVHLSNKKKIRKPKTKKEFQQLLTSLPKKKPKSSKKTKHNTCNSEARAANKSTRELKTPKSSRKSSKPAPHCLKDGRLHLFLPHRRHYSERKQLSHREDTSL